MSKFRQAVISELTKQSSDPITIAQIATDIKASGAVGHLIDQGAHVPAYQIVKAIKDVGPVGSAKIVASDLKHSARVGARYARKRFSSFTRGFMNRAGKSGFHPK